MHNFTVVYWGNYTGAEENSGGPLGMELVWRHHSSRRWRVVLRQRERAKVCLVRTAFSLCCDTRKELWRGCSEDSLESPNLGEANDGLPDGNTTLEE
jgi:hypothetical protein